MSLAAKQEGNLDLSGLSMLSSMLDTPQIDGGRPRMISVTLIREDPENHRHASNPGFSEASIAELADSIRARGIKSPLSLRPDPDAPGHYIINHGHRRFRAALVAGLTAVPAFIDEVFDQFDQVIENIQRENLTAREIADFIGAQLAGGLTKTEIANRLGKSKAFVTQHAALLELPEPVADAFHAGRVRDVTLANELARAYRENPQAVEAALAVAPTTGESDLAAKSITRGAVKSLRKQRARAKPSTDLNSNRGTSTSTAADGSQSTIHLDAISAEIKKRIGIDATITHTAAGAMQLTITLQNHESLLAFLSRLGLDASLEAIV